MNGEGEKSESEHNEVLTQTETIEVKRQGTVDQIRFPRHWRRTVPEFRGDLMFKIHVERRGKDILLIGKLVNGEEEDEEDENEEVNSQ